jgi:hypothetical protein
MEALKVSIAEKVTFSAMELLYPARTQQFVRMIRNLADFSASLQRYRLMRGQLR